MLLQKGNQTELSHLLFLKSKPLSDQMQTHLSKSSVEKPSHGITAKALQYARPAAAFTVEAAFIVPLFVFAAVVVVGLFPMLLVQSQVNHALQYAARTLAASYTNAEDETDGSSLLVGMALVKSYLSENGCDTSLLKGGLAGISLLDSTVEEDYVLLCADYTLELPVSFWKVTSLPVTQCVQMKKWTGADPDNSASDGDYVYITPSGTAYHASAECSYLKLSISTTSLSALDTLRNKSGAIYYACSCYNGSTVVYITDYGTNYHSDLSCSGLKRTIYRVSIDAVGDRHACSKCY